MTRRSRRADIGAFYEKFGEDVTNELVNWGNDRRECFSAPWMQRIDRNCGS